MDLRPYTAHGYRTYVPMAVKVHLVRMVETAPLVRHCHHAPVKGHCQLEGVLSPHLVHSSARNKQLVMLMFQSRGSSHRMMTVGDRMVLGYCTHHQQVSRATLGLNLFLTLHCNQLAKTTFLLMTNMLLSIKIQMPFRLRDGKPPWRLCMSGDRGLGTPGTPGIPGIPETFFPHYSTAYR